VQCASVRESRLRCVEPPIVGSQAELCVRARFGARFIRKALIVANLASYAVQVLKAVLRPSVRPDPTREIDTREFFGPSFVPASDACDTKNLVAVLRLVAHSKFIASIELAKAAKADTRRLPQRSRRHSEVDRGSLVTDPCRVDDDEAFRRVRRRSERVAAVAITIGVLLAVAVVIVVVLAYRLSTSGP
jgi:hypothetical protein